jgi:hypothetical protein
MSNLSLKVSSLALAILLFAGCAEAPNTQPGPPPPQNLLGSTDELQLVTELSLNLAREYGGKNVLVVLEIDGTLLTGMPGQNANPCARSADAQSSPMHPIQENAPQLVQRIQDAGLKVVVLTARGPECRSHTFMDLRNNGFDFTAQAWPPVEGYPEPFLLAGGNRPVVYEDGVFFTAGQNKGLMLKALLEKAGDPQPILIVMADQSRESLNDVMKAFSWSSTKIQAWRYTRADTETAGP